MAKLRDLVNVNINVDYLEIQGEKFYYVFNVSIRLYSRSLWKAVSYFEKDLNQMLQKDQVTLRGNELKIIRSLMYGMVRAGGTECTIKELEGAIAINEIVSAYETVMDVFVNGNFQQKDLETVKSNRKIETSAAKIETSGRNRNSLGFLFKCNNGLVWLGCKFL